MEVCIDRFSVRRSCCCWLLRRFRRSTAEAMGLVAAGMAGLLRTAAGSVATQVLRLLAVRVRVLVRRRVRSPLARLRVRHSPLEASTGALIAGSIVTAESDSELTASELTVTTTATGVWALTLIRGDTRVRSIRTGGGIRVRRMTRISNTRLAWRTR